MPDLTYNIPTYEQQAQAITLLQELGVDIDTLLAGRVVKSVQRGVVTFSSTAYVTVNFSDVDLSKSYISISASSNAGTVYYDNATLSKTSMRLYINGYTSTLQVNWQILEFY